MENLTHALLGATLAELALPKSASAETRRLFYATAIIASNLPDADLLYTRITAAPLGYLLHHRGHTHTLIGLVVQAIMIGIVLLLPALRRRVKGPVLQTRLAGLVVVSLLGHLILDSWNSYGVHPFWPVSSRWFYGDAIYIVEPWLWLILGITVVANAHRAPIKRVLGAVLVSLAVAVWVVGLISAGALGALAVGAILWSGVVLRRTPHMRAAHALGAMSLFVAGMFLASRAVRREVITSMNATTSEIVDVILNPVSANPLCWNVLAIEKNEQAGEYLFHRGTTTLARGILACGASASKPVRWDSPERQSLAQLRTLQRGDCRVRAWMQFGRAPTLTPGAIGDARFGGAERGNFSAMTLLPPGSPCPSNLTNWTFPRADLL